MNLMKPHNIVIVLVVGMALTSYSDTDDASLKDRLTNIIIPRVEFRDANITDVLYFLFDATIAASPDRKPDIHLSRMIANNTQQAIHNGPMDAARPGKPTPPTITLNRERISLYDLITEVTEMADLDFEFEDGQLILLTKDGRRLTRQKAPNQSIEPTGATRAGDLEQD